MRVYAVKIKDISEAEAGRFLPLLDDDRRTRVWALRNRGQKLQCIYAGLLLRHAFLRAGFPEAKWRHAEILRQEQGKPYIKGYETFQYSLSHSGDWVICAADTEPVGADIQEIKPWKERLADRFYSREEYGRLLALREEPERQTREFYRMWTAKESAAKLGGQGIGAGIGRYVASGDYRYVLDVEQNEEIRMITYEELEGYEACVCGGSGIFPERLELTDLGGESLAEKIKSEK